jgi:hypothetical protein
MAISVSATPLKQAIILAACVILGLGVLREIFISVFGVETAFKTFHHFELDDENSLPAWFSSLLLTGAALLLCVIARAHAERGELMLKRSFYFLAVIFIIMSADETASFHESLIKPLHAALSTSGVLTYAWLVVAIPALAVIGALLLPMLWRIPRKFAALFILSGTLFVAGAVGLEMVGGWLDDNGQRFLSDGVRYTSAYQAAVILEESLEVLGSASFMFALLDYLQTLLPRFSVVLVGARERRPDQEWRSGLAAQG